MTPPDNAVPLVDLRWQHAEIADEVAAGWAEVLASTSFIQGRPVRVFEAEFAAYTGAARCIGVASGTDALELSLRAAGVRHGDPVVVPTNTFVASVEAIVRAGGVPQFVDCDPDHFLIDVAQTNEAMQDARAVMPVHLYGQLAPVDALERVAAQTGCVVVEDAAQAHGATRHGRGIGTWGALAATSFYPGKNLGAYGDAGAVLTGDLQLERQVRLLGDHGSERKYAHTELGFNSRLDTLQAVVLRAKLARLDSWNAQRRAAAARYAELFAGDERIVLPTELDGNVHVWHLYVVRVPARDEVLGHLRSAGIEAAIHYPEPVHLHPAFAQYANGRYPVAERLAREILSLPIYPGISEAAQERVVAETRRALDITAGTRRPSGVTTTR